MLAIAKGIWCNKCEYFESEDDLEGSNCMSCGCSKSDHTHVHVVAA